MSFDKLKKNREKQFDQIASSFTAANNSVTYSSESDERMWYPQADKAGNGSAVIRFMPATDTAPNGLPFVREYKHAFQGPTGTWFIELCPTTLGKDCPVCNANRELWNSGVESDKKIASARKRRLSYYSNVLVVSDPGNPENEGKVKIYRYGKKIFDMLNDQMNPPFADQEAVNPFDFWEGANLRLRFRNKDGYRNYDASTFDSPKALFDGDDAQLEELYNKLYDLSEFADPSLFKSYEKLEERLKMVASGSTPARRKVEEVEVEEEDSPFVESDTSDAVELNSGSGDDDFDALFDELKAS